MREIKIALAMLTNALLLGLALLVFLDGRNPYMGFLGSGATKVYLLVLCAVGVTTVSLYIASLRR